MESLRVLAFIGLLLLGAGTLYPLAASAACYSGHPTVGAERRESKFVISGRSLASRDAMSSDDPAIVGKTIYDVAVLKTYKGAPGRTISITSVNTSSRFPIDVGKVYILFISEYGGDYFVDSCGNSGEIAEKKTVLNELESRH
jgi:hypothetical protein